MIAGEKSRLSPALFLSTWLIYALFSYPFPKEITYVEVLIGVMLMLFVGSRNAFVVLSLGGKFHADNRRGIKIPAWIYVVFMYWLVVPLMLALVYHWELRDVFRDLVPVLYLFFPVLLLPAMSTADYPWAAKLPWWISIGGIIFSIRYFFGVDLAPWEIGETYYIDDLNYLPYEPAVLYGIIFFTGMALIANQKNFVQRALTTIGLLCGSLICFTALGGIVQRAPLGLATIAILLLSFRAIKSSPFLVVVVAAAFVGVFWAFSAPLVGLFDLLQEKQAVEGLSAKFVEFTYIIENVSNSVGLILFGHGWGSTYYNAVLGGDVRFTHSLLSYSLFKVGLLGLASVVVTCSFLVFRAARSVGFSLFTDPAVLAGLSTIIIGLFFQPTYKVLTYGIVLLITILRARALIDARSRQRVFTGFGFSHRQINDVAAMQKNAK
jgi:hypothetical protein